jgi:thiol:disulfide interchange protein DsbD
MLKILMGCCLLLAALPSFAQTSPVKWTFTAKKKTGDVFEVHLTANVPAPWHIYSQKTPAGGPLPTKILFNSNPLVTVTGGAGEDGKAATIHDRNFGVDVIYFQNSVSFVQTIKLKAAVRTSLHGTVEYMACNDKECLPPVTIPFDIILN